MFNKLHSYHVLFSGNLLDHSKVWLSTAKRQISWHGEYNNCCVQALWKNIFYTRCSCRVDKLHHCAIILTWSFALYYKLYIKIVLFSLIKLHNLPCIFFIAFFAIVNSSHVVFRTSVAETFTKSLVRISRSPHSCYLVDTNSRQKELLHHS